MTRPGRQHAAIERLRLLQAPGLVQLQRLVRRRVELAAARRLSAAGTAGAPGAFSSSQSPVDGKPAVFM